VKNINTGARCNRQQSPIKAFLPPLNEFAGAIFVYVYLKIKLIVKLEGLDGAR